MQNYIEYIILSTLGDLSYHHGPLHPFPHKQTDQNFLYIGLYASIRIKRHSKKITKQTSKPFIAFCVKRSIFSDPLYLRLGQICSYNSS